MPATTAGDKENKMELFHTSPGEISQINRFGRFGEFLFFSSSIYRMTAGEFVAYRLEVSDVDLIDAGSLFYHPEAEKLSPLVSEFCARFGVDTDTAEEIISERAELDSCDADKIWDAQTFTGRAAKLLGFRGVCVADEQGSAYMIDMLGRESELVRI
jgi:hypothetical protein